MRDVFSCAHCSNRIVTRTAGFISTEESTCSLLEQPVTVEDGCTFGDCDGPVPGVIPYDIDLSTSRLEDYEMLY